MEKAGRGRMDDVESASTIQTRSTYTVNSMSTNGESRVTVTSKQTSTMPSRVDGKIVVGGRSYDQKDFWKGRIPGVRQTYPFPRTRPIIFHNKVVGQPTKFGPYGKYTKGPPSPPPPTPVRIDIFPKGPTLCCGSCRRKPKDNAKESDGKVFGINTTDPNADLSLDTAGFDCCSALEYHISPHFRYKSFQRRFLFKMMWIIQASYIAPIALLIVVVFVKPVHHYLMTYADAGSYLITFGGVMCLYLALMWFSGKARYRPWPIIVVIVRAILVCIATSVLAIITEQLYLSFEIDQNISPDEEDEQKEYMAELKKPHSLGYWPILGFMYQMIFRLTAACVTRFTKCHYSDPAMKVILYYLLWSFFCLQGAVVFSKYGKDIFKGSPLFDILQTNMALFAALTTSNRTLKNFHALFAGKFCAMTEREYTYCLLRVAN